ncbi:methionine synthase vitamin-B12 independent [Clavulina sp. PMI_390]|nr:methionine synthase vitamin-B12 independent [Clavulina sp. PMI_390]
MSDKAAILNRLHFDHPGSYLRTEELLRARLGAEKHEVSKAELRAVEDRTIAGLVAKQLAVGMPVVTDGEARRAYFHLDFLQQLEGGKYFGVTVSHNNLDTGDANWTPPVLTITGKIRHVRPIQLDDFLFLKARAGSAVPKVCIPSPTMAHFRGGRAAISQEVYPELDDFFADLVAAYRAEIRSLYDAGCRFIQLDDTNLAYLCDAKMRASVAERGDDVESLPDRYAALINACIQDRPSDLVIGMHLCRGNFRSRFFASGGYEPVAKTIFEDIKLDVLYLEWESDRAGNFEPLRFLVPGRKVVLGLLSSKFSDLEDKGQIIRRINEASKFCKGGLNQLALSTQCGFSSTYHGNAIREEDQWKKLALIREIADEVWSSKSSGQA